MMGSFIAQKGKTHTSKLIKKQKDQRMVEDSENVIFIAQDKVMPSIIRKSFDFE